MRAHVATIFLSAFLLFQIQPIIAKQLLPWFGGTAAVWAVCLFFFQGILLLGYLYSHWVVSKVGPSLQPWLHVALLTVSLFWLPAIPDEALKPSGEGDPALRLVAVLFSVVGLPYFLLSTTGPLVQAWYARCHSQGVPYRLFALSNAASLAALLAYPFLVEPAISTSHQAWIWSVGYAAFTALCGYTAATTARRTSREPDRHEAIETAASPVNGPPAARDYILWICLAMLPSALLLAITNHLTKNLASIPFLWVLPLSVYLATFILCFDRDGWYRRGVFIWALAGAVALMGGFLWIAGLSYNFKLSVLAFLVGLFFACMFGHGELAARKPHPRYLTNFYLMVSAGGALGGLFVSVVAPALFVTYYELPVCVVALAVFGLFLFYRKSWQTDAAWAGVCVFVLAPVLGSLKQTSLAIDRDFYGVVRVERAEYHERPVIRMVHDSTLHGWQLAEGPETNTPFSYYSAHTGIGRAMAQFDQSVRLGVVGLGTGTLAAYGKPGDSIRFYEINPTVTRFARSYFTFLSDTQAKVDVVHGDARLSLEREEPQRFDALVIDAFSGDSIPVHLLSVEALQLYLSHMKSGGLLAVHISNRFLDLRPVLERAAAELELKGAAYHSPEDAATLTDDSTWVLLARDMSRLAWLQGEARATWFSSRPEQRLWTDDYSNLLQALR